VLTCGDLFVRQADQLLAAAAQLDVNVAQRGALKAQPGSLMMIRTAQVADFTRGVLLEFLYPLLGTRNWRGLKHETILPLNCFFAACHNSLYCP
jgi:hypothetical protein